MDLHLSSQRVKPHLPRPESHLHLSLSHLLVRDRKYNLPITQNGIKDPQW